MVPGLGAKEGERMDLTEKLRVWGAVHAQARSARESAAKNQKAQALAQQLQLDADRLHREIYDQIGSKPAALRVGLNTQGQT